MLKYNKSIEKACEHYRFSDYRLFLHGYLMIFQDVLINKTVLEICCGKGELAALVASSISEVNVIGIDISAQNIMHAKTNYANINNLRFITGDVFNLDEIEDETIDIVIGQAALHHLQNNLVGISKEISRILKKGGKCIFIFEPIGHNFIISAIRAAINSRTKLLDEANLYENAFQIFVQNFSKYEIYYFNLFGYFCKLLPKSSFSKIISLMIYKLDNIIYKTIPSARKYSANANICFWK